MIQRLSRFWSVVAAIILALGAYGAFIRFTQGLGASTGLTDAFPWGLWIGFDVLVGVGLAASGFTIAATVHIFNAEKYESISRPSLLTAFVGYMLVMVALVFEIGRPLRLWHPLIMWNPHSVMFEVAWCVMLYSTVLALEFSPIVFEHFKLKLPLAVIRTIYLPVVILGVILSTLHQSSLGTYFLIVPDKIHGLWYSPLLPVFFFLTAIAGGLAMTVVQSFLSARAFGRPLKHEVLAGLARIFVVVLAVYMVLKFRDLAYRDNLKLAFEFNTKSVMFWIEIGMGGLLPMLLVFFNRHGIKDSRLFLSSLLVVIGFIVNRMNVSITGMRGSEAYIPKWTEVAITLGLVTGGFVVFTLVAQYLPVFPKEEDEEGGLHKHYFPLPRRAVVGLWVIALVAGCAYSMAEYKGNHMPVTEPHVVRSVDISAQKLEQLPPDFIIPGSGDSPGKVNFSHSNHADTGGAVECRSCHGSLFSLKINDSMARPTGEGWHAEAACGACHNGKRAFKVKGNCETCHVEE